jgi:predicted membrane channel-forming protein YqfA (hemolysin III family)
MLAAWAVSAAYDDINVWDGWRESKELRKPVYAETVRVLPALIAAVLLFGVLDRFRKTTTLSIRWLLLAGLSLTVAVACRQLDVHGRFSGSDSWFQGHSFWHFFTALCLYCMYRYYRSEKDVGLPSK